MLESLLPFLKKRAKVNGELNEDLLQELIETTLGKALRNFDTNKDVKFITYLSYILHHKKLKFLKQYHNDLPGVNIDSFANNGQRKYRMKSISIDNTDNNLESELLQLTTSQSSVEEDVIEKDIKEKVVELLDKTVYGRDNDIIKDYLFKQKTYQEIADERGISSQRIGQIYHKAIEKFKKTCKYYGLIG